MNEELEVEGILRTMFDPRNNLSNDVAAQLISHFGDRVFRTIIPRNVRLAEAPSFGVPVMLHDKDSRGALAYLALAGEMIRRSEEPEAYFAETGAGGGRNGRHRRDDHHAGRVRTRTGTRARGRVRFNTALRRNRRARGFRPLPHQPLTAYQGDVHLD